MRPRLVVVVAAISVFWSLASCSPPASTDQSSPAPSTTVATPSPPGTVDDLAPNCPDPQHESPANCFDRLRPQLEATLRELTRALAYNDPAYAARLDTMTDRWIAQRDDECQLMFVVPVTSGSLPGHGFGQANASCRYELTASRIRSLREMIGR